ncbi:MAG: hypothetical protein OEW90_15385, partial [Betaproteobacteria bacterium]|nr:hypothetical protein [Betaproteobacteria bacterium]
MFGFGKKKNDAPASESPDSETGGGLSSNRVRVGLLAVVLVAALGYLAYEYLPALLDPAPPPMPAQVKPKPVPAAKAPAAPEPVAAKPAPTPAAKPEPVAKPEPKPEPGAKPAP